MSTPRSRPEVNLHKLQLVTCRSGMDWCSLRHVCAQPAPGAFSHLCVWFYRQFVSWHICVFCLFLFFLVVRMDLSSKCIQSFAPTLLWPIHARAHLCILKVVLILVDGSFGPQLLVHLVICAPGSMVIWCPGAFVCFVCSYVCSQLIWPSVPMATS